VALPAVLGEAVGLVIGHGALRIVAVAIDALGSEVHEGQIPGLRGIMTGPAVESRVHAGEGEPRHLVHLLHPGALDEVPGGVAAGAIGSQLPFVHAIMAIHAGGLFLGKIREAWQERQGLRSPWRTGPCLAWSNFGLMRAGTQALGEWQRSQSCLKFPWGFLGSSAEVEGPLNPDNSTVPRRMSMYQPVRMVFIWDHAPWQLWHFAARGL
jgi:hypothetical protein